MEFAFPLVIVIVLVLAGVVALIGYTVRKSDQQTKLKGSETETLRYHVPQGQDPSVPLAALREHGYEATPDVEGTVAGADVLVPCPNGREAEREKVRSIIQNTHQINLEGDTHSIPRVLFADE